MYGKIFEDIFCSTLMDYGGDTAYVFMAMIVLSDEDGYIKHTDNSLARQVCKPVEVVREAIRNLETQDARSNIKAHDGRRIVPLRELMDDETRGWLVVNKEIYRDRASKEDKRKADRDRISEKRNKTNGVANSRIASHLVANVAHTDTDTDTDKKQRRAFALPAWVSSEAWKAFEDSRTKLRKPMTDRARSLVIHELEKLKDAGHDPRNVLEQSVRKGWLDVFPLKDQPAKPVGEVI